MALERSREWSRPERAPSRQLVCRNRCRNDRPCALDKKTPQSSIFKPKTIVPSAKSNSFGRPIFHRRATSGDQRQQPNSNSRDVIWTERAARNSACPNRHQLTTVSFRIQDWEDWRRNAKVETDCREWSFAGFCAMLRQVLANHMFVPSRRIRNAARNHGFAHACNRYACKLYKRQFARLHHYTAIFDSLFNCRRRHSAAHQWGLRTGEQGGTIFSFSFFSVSFRFDNLTIWTCDKCWTDDVYWIGKVHFVCLFCDCYFCIRIAKEKIKM